ncbi:MAG: ABC transporter permease subunit [Anaerolineaceae bacterium]|nr:ABC transporter permease subunit [Anaerolineaceae bacterium]
MSGVIFVNTLKMHWRGAFYWGIGLGLLAYYILVIIPDMSALSQFEAMAETLPPVFMQLLGASDAAMLATPEGFIGFGFFGYALLLLAVYAVLAGLNVTANEEDEGILDIVLSLPLARWRLVLEKSAAHMVLTLLIVVFSLVGLLLGIQQSALELNTGRLVEATVNMLPGVLFMIALTIFVSVLVRRKSVAIGIVAGIIAASYFMDFVSKAVTNDLVQVVQKFSFYTYYDSGGVIVNGLNMGNIALLLGITGVLMAGSLWFFNHRDIGL